jgi:polysaccharide export outer membrane protein
MKCLNRLVAISAVSWLAFSAMSRPVVAQKIGAPDYIIGPSDVLAIAVFNQEKLTNKYSVGSDGSFTFPYIGRVAAGGLTVQAVETDIRERLSKSVLKDPQVTVIVDQYRSQQVYVVGQVRQPQTLQFTGSMNLIDALARAGGLTDKAGAEVLIARPSAGAAPTPPSTDAAGPAKSDPNVIRISLEKLQSGDFSQNVPLLSGYIVSVPQAETVFVEGQVARTGEYPIRPGMTVRQVIALAGGITDIGSDTRIVITRDTDGKKAEIKAKLDDAVRSHDIIKVPKRWF